MSKLLTVEIKALTFDTIIGILDYERTTPQKVIIDISFSYSFDSDSKDFVNYAEVSELTKKTMNEKKFELIEDAILYLEHLLYKTFTIKDLTITIAKPEILDDCIVSVSTKNSSKE